MRPADRTGDLLTTPVALRVPELTAQDRVCLEAKAMEAGFDKIGIAAAPPPGSPEDLQQQARYKSWVEQGRAGEMAWLTRTDSTGELVRSSLHRVLPWVRSVVLCAKVYNAPAPRSIEPAPAGSGWIARYAWSGAASATSAMGEPSTLTATDYHDVMLLGLEQVVAVLHAQYGSAMQARCYVDTGPVVERHLAQLSGIGWIGKNTCVIDQTLGSWMLLGTILTSLPLAAEASMIAAADRCGSCTRCLDACPTQALVAPREMDASRCISYLTIEKKGSIPEDLREGIGRQVFGCDICQDVCPWNRKAPIAGDPGMQMRPELVNPSLDWLGGMDAQAFKRSFRGSPLERTGHKRLQRNVAIAMGNSGDGRYRDRLQTWAIGNDPTLAEAAQWALNQLDRAPAGEPIAPVDALLASG